MNKTPHKNTKQKLVETTYIFDVEGVLTVPYAKKVDLELINKIENLLSNGNPVILNTGRSIPWVVDKILSKFASETALDNLLCICEKGTASIESIDDNLTISIQKEKSFLIPEKLKKRVKELIVKKYSSTMFFDETKLTMITAEMNPNLPDIPNEEFIRIFNIAQKYLISDLEQILTNEKLDKFFKITPTTIATDIEHVDAGKDLGVQRALEWLKKCGISTNNFVTFGDSLSDFAMPLWLFMHKFIVEHVHVGKETDIPRNIPYRLVVTTFKYNDGVKEYFR